MPRERLTGSHDAIDAAVDVGSRAKEIGEFLKGITSCAINHGSTVNPRESQSSPGRA